MKKNIRSLFLLLFTLYIAFMFSVLSPKDVVAYSKKVRIGLYYGADSVVSVSISAVKGVDIGYLNQGKFVRMLEADSSEPVVIKKDSYFVRKNDGTLVEYNPNEGVPYEGSTTGPYHIRIGDKSPDYASALILANSILKSGIEAYVVYENGWWVWTGFFPDSKTANSQAAAISNKLKTANLTVIPPTPSRIVIYSSSYRVKMLYGGVNGPLQLRPKEENDPYLLSVNGKKYRGFIEIRRYADSDLTVINELDLEQYLYGVVPYEIESDSPMEALKAQAVAARTYAYRSLRQYSKWGFDMVDTVSSQVYGGYDGERKSTNIAVDQTKGKRIFYDGKLAQVFYFSSSGGMTADNKYVWGSEVPYLKNVEDPYESQTSYHYTWEKILTAADIKRILFVSGVDIGDIVSVVAEEYSPSGRVTKLVITGTGGSNGNKIVYYNADTRYIFNLYSQKYTVSSNSNVVAKALDGSFVHLSLEGRTVITGLGKKILTQSQGPLTILGSGNKRRVLSASSSDSFIFSGKGWGHGLGMSQEGAKGFAEHGYTYEQILKHYFKGVIVK